MPSQLTTSSGVITVRPAVPEDAAALRELRLEALARHPRAFAADYDATAAESVEQWAERITTNTLEEKAVICVAAAGGLLIGMTGMARGHWPKTHHGAIIWGVYVKADWRGLHIAEALLDECFAWGRANGIVMVRLAVITSNAPAIRCYVRCGFTVYGIEPQVIYHDGVYDDELLMARPV